jgi:hypothetical protein
MRSESVTEARKETLRFGSIQPTDWGARLRGFFILVRFRRILIALSCETAISDCNAWELPQVSPWQGVTAQIGVFCRRFAMMVNLTDGRNFLILVGPLREPALVIPLQREVYAFAPDRVLPSAFAVRAEPVDIRPDPLASG